MKLGDVINAGAASNGKPLDGIRVLAAEQMQALPFATQVMARLGADVVKVEHPDRGDMGRGATPYMVDPYGRRVGSTFLRTNLGKRSIAIDLKTPEGRDLFLRLAPRFDVIAENFKSGAMAALGLDYEAVAAVHPNAVYLSLSGFGAAAGSPYAGWPAYAPVAEAMAGLYQYKRFPDERPVAAPVGALGDIGAACFAVVGVLAALRHRERTGEGQLVDIAMLDAMIAFADLIPNFWSMGAGVAPDELPPAIVETFRAADGWFVVLVFREHEFLRLATAVGRDDWHADTRLTDRQGWVDHMDEVIRPAVESWAGSLTKLEACRRLAAGGVACGPCNTAADVVADEHVALRNMLVEVPRTDGVETPFLVPGNPVKLSKVAEGPETMVPFLGADTDAVLRAELGLSDADLDRLRGAGAIRSTP